MDTSLIYRASNINEALRQGEILAEVVQYKLILEELPNISFPVNESLNLKATFITYPYVIVISQDCDLDWDYKARKDGIKPFKKLDSILLCQVYTAQDVRTPPGESRLKSELWNYIKTNRDRQYHFLEKVPSQFSLNKKDLPEFTVDFKKIFSVDTETLYYLIENNVVNRLTVLQSPYLEHFSQRYHAFHGRVGLPEDHQSE
jgi:hypothetical protein